MRLLNSEDRLVLVELVGYPRLVKQRYCLCLSKHVDLPRDDEKGLSFSSSLELADDGDGGVHRGGEGVEVVVVPTMLP